MKPAHYRGFESRYSEDELNLMRLAFYAGGLFYRDTGRLPTENEVFTAKWALELGAKFHKTAIETQKKVFYGHDPELHYHGNEVD